MKTGGATTTPTNGLKTGRRAGWGEVGAAGGRGRGVLPLIECVLEWSRNTINTDLRLLSDDYAVNCARVCPLIPYHI